MKLDLDPVIARYVTLARVESEKRGTPEYNLDLLIVNSAAIGDLERARDRINELEAILLVEGIRL
jgi:hypothetical protein